MGRCKHHRGVELLQRHGVTISIIDDGLDHASDQVQIIKPRRRMISVIQIQIQPPLVMMLMELLQLGSRQQQETTGGRHRRGFGANLAGSRLLACLSGDSLDASALGYMPQDIDIYSNSWGPLTMVRLFRVLAH